MPGGILYVTRAAQMLVFGFLLCGGSLAQETPPNIVLIVSDDQGYGDLGCFGSGEALTPHLDRLAEQGVRLTNFYVSWPACTPSRGSLLTGRYPQRHGVFDMIRNEAPDYGHQYTPAEYAVTFERIGGMDTREVLLPALLRPAGYRSGIFGKWDLGSLARFLPTARGFERFYGFVNTGIDYFTHERYGVPSMYRDELPTQEDRGVYCTELFQREALAFLEDASEEPFLLYLPFNAPHSASNLDPTIRSAAQGTDTYKALFPELQKQAGTQAGTRYGQPATVRNKSGRRLEYLAAVAQMDAAIGAVLDRLDTHGLADNTLVIFFSDNGGGGGSDNGPLRGGKGQMFEGGIRVPAIVRFPGKIPAGEVREQFCSSMDLVPTLLKLCGVEAPAGLVLDGYDLMPMLTQNADSPRTEMVWQRKADIAVRKGPWKWVHSGRGSGLFDLTKDLGEKHDLSESNPDKLAELKQVYAAWRETMEQAEPRGPFRDF